MDAIPDVTFRQARAVVNARRPVSFRRAMESLEEARIAMTSAAVLAAYAPEALRNIGPVPLVDGARGNNALDEYSDKAIYHVLPTLFQLYEDDLAENILNLEPGSQVNILPGPMLFDYTADSFLEMVDNPENFYNEQPNRLMTFIRYLDFGISPDCFCDAEPVFGWPVDDFYHWLIGSYDLIHFDIKKFKRSLKRAGLDDFLLAFEAVWGETGNLFIDCTLSDFFDDDSFTYDLETVRHLHEQYLAALPILRDIEALCSRIDNDPSIYTKLARAWKRSFVSGQARHPRTLVEVFDDPHHD